MRYAAVSAIEHSHITNVTDIQWLPSHFEVFLVQWQWAAAVLMGLRFVIGKWKDSVLWGSQFVKSIKQVTVPESFVLLGDRGRITEQSPVCFPVFICRLEQTCFQLATKSSGRLQLCRQPVPCSQCSDIQSPVDSSTCPWHDEVARRRSTQCRSSGYIGDWCQ